MAKLTPTQRLERHRREVDNLDSYWIEAEEALDEALQHRAEHRTGTLPIAHALRRAFLKGYGHGHGDGWQAHRQFTELANLRSYDG